MRNTILTLCLSSILLLAGTMRMDASRVDTVTFRGDSSHVVQRLCIYTPDGYTESDTAIYPLIYLLHGIHGNHYSWLRDGNVRPTLDSLMRNRLVREMVVVMPYCQRFDTTDVDEPKSLLHCLLHYGSIVRGEFEQTFFEIDDYVNAHYRVYTDRHYRAVAGLSCGARQAAVLARTGSFDDVGLFCPVIHVKQLPIDSIAPAHYWVGVTEGDVFLYKGRRFCLNAGKRGIPVTLYQDKGSHNWKAWRKMLDIFLCSYFPATMPADTNVTDKMQPSALE